MAYAATIGFFDGVHCGHRWLIRQLTDEARRRGLRSLLLTFDRHPREVIGQGTDIPQLLSTHEEKLHLLGRLEADEVRVLHFTQELASLTARQFMERVLRDELGVKTLVIGYDHHFGRPQPTADGHREGFADYQAYGQELGIEVVEASAYNPTEGTPPHISSSAIRKALQNGDVASANRMLGQPYHWKGNVVHGHEMGRHMGFPTANLMATEPQKILPLGGVYAVRCYLQDQPEAIPGMLNIGQRPTMNNGTDTSIEVHLIGFHGSLYGQELTIEFVERLRDESRFDSKRALRKQLIKDREEVIRTLGLKRSHWWVYVLIFLISQLAAAGTSMLLSTLGYRWNMETMLVGTLMLANLTAILLYLWLKPEKVTWQRTCQGTHKNHLKRIGWCIAVAIPAIFLTNLAQEVLFPNLPNFIEDATMRTLLNNPCGIIIVCLIGPLSEEMLFRGGVQEALWSHSVLGSALIFALVHMNPVQMPAAFILGCLLGFSYWWTGSMVAPISIHVLNNTLACIGTWLSPENDSMVDLLGGTSHTVSATIICLLWLLMAMNGITQMEKQEAH